MSFFRRFGFRKAYRPGICTKHTFIYLRVAAIGGLPGSANGEDLRPGAAAAPAHKEAHLVQRVLRQRHSMMAQRQFHRAIRADFVLAPLPPRLTRKRILHSEGCGHTDTDVSKIGRR